MGLGFSPLPYLLQLNRLAPSNGTAGKQHNRSSVVFFNRDPEPPVGKQQQASATERPTALAAAAG